MRRLLISVVVACLASVLSGQSAPRGPVIPSDRGGDPGPQPGPDPSGVYAGLATFTFGNQGSFTQPWRVPLKAQPCPGCAPGEYAISGTDYELVGYEGGANDRGSVSGMIGLGGTGYLELQGTNCSYVTYGLGGVSTYKTGRVGPSPGNDIRVSGGNLTGRLSGYDCNGNLVVADLNLHKQSGTSAKTCPYFGGSYFGAYANSCGGSQSGYVVLTQAGCAISGYSAGAATAIQGILTSATAATFDFESTVGCGSGSGTAQITNGVIRGTYSGTSNGGAGCCPPGPFTGSFTLTP